LKQSGPKEGDQENSSYECDIIYKYENRPQSFGISGGSETKGHDPDYHPWGHAADISYRMNSGLQNEKEKVMCCAKNVGSNTLRLRVTITIFKHICGVVDLEGIYLNADAICNLIGKTNNLFLTLFR
jgi:hypothetical protein